MPHSFAIVPAAGMSQRMGQPKLLLPWRDGTVLDAVLRAWRASRVSETILVVRPGDASLIALGRRAGVRVVVAPTPPPEMKITVRVGLEFVEREFQPAEDDHWLLAPADLPRLSPDVIDRVLTAAAQQPHKICLPVHQGRRGHPVAFPWPLADAVHRLASTEGVNALLKRNPVVEIDCADVRVLDDMDTPADYQSLSDDDQRHRQSPDV